MPSIIIFEYYYDFLVKIDKVEEKEHFFLNKLISLFPNIKLITQIISIASVVVFIPPDVLAGEPPTNI